MEIKGKLVAKMQPTRGTSSQGKEWVKQDFIVETQETYPKKVCITGMGNKSEELNKYNVGDSVKVSVNIESREYNGKWYTNVNVWKIEAGEQSTAPQTPITEPKQQEGSDDLPF